MIHEPFEPKGRSVARAPGSFHNPYVFVVGCPRSGTTLLQRMLDHHPLLAVANDTHFIPRCLEQAGGDGVARASRGEAVPLTPKLVTGVSEYHRFRRLGLDPAEVDDAASESATYATFVGQLYARFARMHGKPCGGEKTPDYVRRLPLLHGLFPRARFLHIIRDGRDVALSVGDWASERKGPGKLELWKRDRVATCALWWSWLVSAGRQHGSALGPARYLEVGYEKLVAEPERELRRIAEFLALPYRPEMLAYHEGKTQADAKLSAKSRWLPPTPGLRNWKTQMPERDVQLFESLAGDLLEAAGYPRCASSASRAVRTDASAAREWWTAFLTHRADKDRQRTEVQP